MGHFYVLKPQTWDTSMYYNKPTNMGHFYVL